MNAVSYFASDRIVLWSYRAKLVAEAEAPGLYRVVRQVTQQANLPMPKVAIVPTETPNAFATGRNPQHAVVAVTQGILHVLTEDELRGVLAHEVSHVRNRDSLVMSVAATLAGAISFGSPASQSLFIVTPFSGGAFVRIFSTHPPIQERIARLRDLAQGVNRY